MPRVLVVGGGPAGASLAFLLARRGIETTLIERQRDFAREFRGEVLMPSGLEAIDQMGLAAEFEGVETREMQNFELYMNAKRCVSVELEPDAVDGRLPAAVSQPGMLEMLVAEAGKHTCFELVRGASVMGVIWTGGRVSGVRIRSDGGERRVNADIVIGADGRASAVRKQTGMHVRHAEPPMDIVWGKLPCPPNFRGVRGYLGRGHLVIAYRSWDDQLQLGWVILKGTFGEIRGRGVEHWITEVAKLVTPDLAAHLRTHAYAGAKPFLLDSASDCVESWSKPGALVIGDAAHTMSPVGGQGLNVALRDAIVTANHLVPLLHAASLDTKALDKALVAIERERMAEIAPIQRLQAIPPRLVLNRAWWGEPLRNLLGHFVSTSFGQRIAMSRISIFTEGMTDVTLEV